MQTPLREKRGSQAGITLIELLFAMTIMTILSTMLVGGWITLQRSYAFTLRTNTARATVRDALDRMSSELRDCQPLTSTGYPIQTAGAYECVFYSAYNQAGAGADGSGNSSTVLRLTRIYLDLSGSSDQKKLWWQRETNGSVGFTDLALDPYPPSGDRRILLATNVVNGASTVNIPYVFTYGYRDTDGDYATNHTMTDPSEIISVQIRLAVDANLGHSPNYIDLTTTVRPRNAGTGFLEEE